MSFKDIRDRFGASFQRGDRVICEGRFGTVASANYSHIRVRFDGKSISAPCDPRDLHLVGPENSAQSPMPQFSVQEGVSLLQ